MKIFPNYQTQDAGNIQSSWTLSGPVTGGNSVAPSAPRAEYSSIPGPSGNITVIFYLSIN